jgi:thiamine-monophosphate kinase
MPAGQGEFDRIARWFAPLAARLPGALGLRDDAGVLDLPAGRQLVVTTDAMVAGVHFLADADPADIAWKLLAVNLSDLAAKGADPLAYSLVTALPADLPADWLERFSAGLAAGQARWGIDLLGGDSVSTAGPVCLTISALGTVPRGRMVQRCGARPGDLVAVTGSVGDAWLGLQLLTGQAEFSVDPASGAALLSRLHRPEPRMGLISALRQFAHAAIDLSDGFAADLRHLAEVSGVRLRVSTDRVPLSPAAAAIVGQFPGLLSNLLAGGDDYEIAFSLSAEDWPALHDAAALAGVEVHVVGRVEPADPSIGAELVIEDVAGTRIVLQREGWQHY